MEKKRERNTFLTPLVVEVMPSGKRFKLHYDFTYRWGKIKINIPAGFVTDFASIPIIFRFIIPKLGRWNKAAVIHDYIYQHHHVMMEERVYYIFNRAKADLCFRDAMRDLGVVKWKRNVMYYAVRVGGLFAWRKRR